MTRCLSGHSNIGVCRKLNVRQRHSENNAPKIFDCPQLVLVRAVAFYRFLTFDLITLRPGLTCWIAAASPTMAVFASGNWRRHWHLRLSLRTFQLVLVPPPSIIILPSRLWRLFSFVLDPYLCPRWVETMPLP